MVDQGEEQDVHTAPRRGRPPALSRREREAQIVAAMERVVGAHGLAQATMERIAQEAGMSKRTLYALFPTRDAVLEAWVKRALADFVRPASPVDRALPLADRLRRVLRRELEAVNAKVRLAVLRAVVGEAPRQPALGRVVRLEGPARAREIVAEELALAQARGEIDVADPAAAADILVDMAFQSLFDLLIDPDLEPETMEAAATRLELALSIFLEGVAAR